MNCASCTTPCCWDWGTAPEPVFLGSQSPQGNLGEERHEGRAVHTRTALDAALAQVPGERHHSDPKVRRTANRVLREVWAIKGSVVQGGGHGEL